MNGRGRGGSNISGRMAVGRFVILIGCLVPLAGGLAVVPAEVPAKLTDQAFWEMVTAFSEEGGFFASNNWVSNETLYQHVVPRLQTSVKPGGIYVGVGPDQNFTYLVGLKPSLAFIVDIRRQNLLHHLMYKALFELSPTRAEFVSRLFGRPRPRDLPDDASAEVLMNAFASQGTSAELINQTSDDMLSRLMRHHGFALSDADRSTLLLVYQAFYTSGPGITYTGMPSLVTRVAGNETVLWRLSPFPGYADLVAMTDAAGVNRGYLANEDHYRQLRDMQLRNAIVPIVGDFAGPKALRAVGKWVKDRGGRVTTIYTSNVEQYLFQNRGWQVYYDSVATMPLDETSTFIRSFFGGAPTQVVYRPAMPPFDGTLRPPPVSFIASSQLTCSVKDLLAAVAAGQVNGYSDVINMSK